MTLKKFSVSVVVVTFSCCVLLLVVLGRETMSTQKLVEIRRDDKNIAVVNLHGRCLQRAVLQAGHLHVA